MSTKDDSDLSDVSNDAAMMQSDAEDAIATEPPDKVCRINGLHAPPCLQASPNIQLH